MSVEALHRRWIVSPQMLGFLAGLAVLAALWLGPLMGLSRISFSAHMMVHLGLVLIAAPLLAMPLARRIGDPGDLGEALRWYLLAGAIEMLVVWGWHVPLLHDAAGTNGVAFAAEQISFLTGGIVLWTAILGARSQAALLAAAIVGFLTFAHMTMFGLLLALAPGLIYDPSLCQGFGGDRVGDQSFGGALMATGSLIYLAAVIVLCARAASRRTDARAL